MVDGIRIDALNSTSVPSKSHELPAMREGLTVKLTVDQILSLISAEEISYEPDTGDPDLPENIGDAIRAIASMLAGRNLEYVDEPPEARYNIGATGNLHKITYVTASTSGFVFDAETRSAEIELLAGGGAGGSNDTGSSSAAAAGGGGGAGEWARKRFAVAGLTSIAIVIGAGGAPGAPGANPGGDGGDTSWDDGVNVVTVQGGEGGQSGAYTSAHIRRAGGAGGSGGSGGDLHVAGQAGEPGVAIGGAIQTIAQLHPHPGKGGDSRWGSAAHAGNTGASSAAGSDGVPSQGYGAGGSGAFGCHADTDRQGSAGRPGLVVVREYR